MPITAIVKDFRSSISFSDNEVTLFRALASSIGKFSDSAFIDETHGQVAQVKFKSEINGPDQCEISDLLIVIKNSVTREYRATFWQAKKESRPRWPLPRGNTNFDFEAQFNQWELLSQRPEIRGLAKFTVHKDILRVARSPSIGSFGVFYKGKSGVELNYSVAEMVSSSGVSKHPRMVINEKLAADHAWENEVLVRTNIQSFLESLFSFEIGAKIDLASGQGNWLANYINSKCYMNDLDSFFVIDERPPDSNSPDQFVGDDDGDGVSVLLINIQDELKFR